MTTNGMFPSGVPKTNFLDWDDDLRHAMTDTKFSVDKHTRIIYLIRDEDDLVDDADLTPNLTVAERRILQVPLGGYEWYQTCLVRCR